MARGNGVRGVLCALLAVVLAIAMSGCGAPGAGQVKLDPKNPTTVTVWHYYNGATKNAFDQIIQEFNDGPGAEAGVFIEGYGLGSVADLEQAVLASARKEVGSQDMPNVFASYADTAYSAEQLGILADLGAHFSEDELKQYLPSYIEEGKIGLNGELKIFPIAKSTEIFMLNETDWRPFADASGLSHADLQTLEGVTRVAELFYDWTDAQTPDVPNDGKAFFGRDAMANLMIIGSKQLGTEIFQVEGGKGEIHVDRAAMRRIWDNYYVPFISGHFAASGRYRSDDAKVGELIAYVGSTASAAYFPSEVTVDGVTHPIECAVLPVPHFEGGAPVIVQQGAGMLVTKSTPEEEYAGALFLKWFTDIEPNIRFSALSGYMPVKLEAINYDKFLSTVEKGGLELDAVTRNTLQVSFAAIKESELYTNKAFDGGADARSVLDRSLADKATADRGAVAQMISDGQAKRDAVAQFDTDANFEAWLSEMTAQLQAAAS